MTAPLQVGETVYVEVYDSVAGKHVYVPALVRGKQAASNPTRPQWVAVELVYTVGDGNEYEAGYVLPRFPGALRRGPETDAGACIDAHLVDLPEVRIDRYQIVPEQGSGVKQGG